MTAQVDQLAAAIAEALRLLEGGSLVVLCPSCGSKPGTPCYGHGPMPPHAVRGDVARGAALDVLRKALGRSLG